MKRLAILALALLAGCDAGTGVDGYRFEHAEWYRPDMHRRTVHHPSLEELRRTAPKAAIVAEGRELMGYSVIKADLSLCTMHVVDQRVLYTPEWVGHEDDHCVYGRYHH